jgi:cadmium resistance protein CadD (predicted permease)
MITAIVAILAGLVLLAGRLGAVPGIGPGLEKFARWLLPFEVVIGVVALVVGILELLSLEGILLILAGLVLAISALRSIPSIGPWLGRMGNALLPFRVIIGVIILVVGLLDLVMILLGTFGHSRP